MKFLQKYHKELATTIANGCVISSPFCDKSVIRHIQDAFHNFKEPPLTYTHLVKQLDERFLPNAQELLLLAQHPHANAWLTPLVPNFTNTYIQSWSLLPIRDFTFLTSVIKVECSLQNLLYDKPTFEQIINNIDVKSPIFELQQVRERLWTKACKITSLQDAKAPSYFFEKIFQHHPSYLTELIHNYHADNLLQPHKIISAFSDDIAIDFYRHHFLQWCSDIINVEKAEFSESFFHRFFKCAQLHEGPYNNDVLNALIWCHFMYVNTYKKEHPESLAFWHMHHIDIAQIYDWCKKIHDSPTVAHLFDSISPLFYKNLQEEQTLLF